MEYIKALCGSINSDEVRDRKVSKATAECMHLKPLLLSRGTYKKLPVMVTPLCLYLIYSFALLDSSNQKAEVTLSKIQGKSSHQSRSDLL
jgi:hypothetical protein